MDGLTKDFHSKGTKLTPEGQNSLLGSNFAPMWGARIKLAIFTPWRSTSPLGGGQSSK
jgi:hypothetical protein